MTAIIAVMIPLPALAQGSPGVMVRWVMEGGPAGAQELTLYTVDSDAGKSRVEIGTQAVMVTNGDTRIMLMPDQKMWMDLAELEAMAARMGRGMAQAGAGELSEDDIPEFEETGETGSFAGIECTYYRSTDDDVVTDICAAKGMGWGLGPSPGGGMMGARGGMPGRGMMGGRGGMGGASTMNSEKYRKLQEQFEDGFFPLEIRVRSGGEMTVRMYATEVDRRNLGDELFPTEGPEGYEKMSMFGRGRGGGS